MRVCRRKGGTRRSQETGTPPGVSGRTGSDTGSGRSIIGVVHEYPALTVHLTLFHAEIVEVFRQKLEHNDIRWIAVDEIDQYVFCPADEKISKRLKQVFERGSTNKLDESFGRG